MKPLFTIAALLLAASAFAQSADDENKLTVTPTGRILMDGAAYISNDPEFEAGVAVPDARLGVKASIGDWKAKVDIGFGYGKVSLKDIFIERKLSPSMLLRMGNFVHQFGLQSATSSSMKISMEEPTSNEVFGYPRLLGAMLEYDKGEILATASLHAETNDMLNHTNELGKTGYGGISRIAWRPSTDDGQIMQIGISGAVSSPQHSDIEGMNHKVYELKANYPTRVSQIKAIDANVTDAAVMAKFTPELLLNYGPVALESQYYWFQLTRHEGPAYRAYGAYGLLRALAIGGNYKYAHADGGIATPGPKSLEFVLGYNYTNLSDSRTGIRGGRMSDVNFTANWYINKYMIWRFRTGYSYRFDRAAQPDVNLTAFQTRLQIIF